MKENVDLLQEINILSTELKYLKGEAILEAEKRK
jgi:cell division septum initiation protein DivIVA